MDYIKTLHALRIYFGEDMIISTQHPDRGLMPARASTDKGLIGYLKWRNVKNENIYFRPALSKEPYYLMVDHDTGIETVYRYHKCRHSGIWKPGRCVIESSPNRYQVFIKFSSPLAVDIKKYWLKILNADPGASPLKRNGRFPGFTNRKEIHCKRDGTYPYAKLHWIDLENMAVVPSCTVTHKLLEKNVLSEGLPSMQNGYSRFSPRRKGGSVFAEKKINRNDYIGHSESETDMSYAMALVKRGYSDDDIITFIKEERRDWSNHKGDKRQNDYLKKTLCKARLWVDMSTSG